MLLFSSLAIILVLIRADDFKTKLNLALEASKKSITEIENRWEIHKYPNFLTSVAMSHTAWEIHKIKYQQRILQAFTTLKPVSYVISFMGSSVTAGHDSPQNVSLVAWTNKLMAPVLEKLDVKLITRNAAMGNNPCLPYDLCPRAFAGTDADIVHWEQSFNCFDRNFEYLYEQFVRQSLVMPNHPIVVFSESPMPNWDDQQCTAEKPPHVLNGEENDLITALKAKEYLKIATELAGRKILRHFSHMTLLLEKYKTAGIQLWRHAEYEVYKCLGPYVKNWVSISRVQKIIIKDSYFCGFVFVLCVYVLDTYFLFFSNVISCY